MGGRAVEITNVAPEHHTVWLAGQIDEVEAVVLESQRELAEQIKALTVELRQTREQMSANTTKVVWTVLTASITLLVSIVGFVLMNVLGAGT